MGMRFNRQIQNVICWTLVLLSPCAQALPRPEIDPENSSRIFVESSYDTTTANYDTDGSGYVALGNGRSYKVFQGRLGGEHWLTEDFSVFAQIGGARSESNDGNFTRTNTSATDLMGGLRYVFGRTPFPVLAEISLAYPFNRVDEYTDDTLTGEGTMKIDSAIWVEFWLSSFRPYGRLGFLYQDGGRSSPAEVLLGAAFDPEGFSIGSEFYYSKTLLEDEFTDTRVRRDTVTTRVDGGSWKYYSVNPEIMGVRAVGSVDLSSTFRLGLVYDHTLNGKASAAGWSALVRLEMGIGNSPSEEEEGIRRPKVLDKEPEESDRFQPEPTSYDDTLFQEAKPKVPKRQRKPKHKRPMDVDKALEEVQKSLEK